MARKKPSASAEPPAASELAVLVHGLKDRVGELPVLADYLEEKLGLPKTGQLLRRDDLCHLPKEWRPSERFRYFPLAADVFLWLADTFRYEKMKTIPYTFVGLYAHPRGQPSQWAKITVVLPRRLEGTDDWSAWLRGELTPDPVLDDARAELEEFARRSPPGGAGG